VRGSDTDSNDFNLIAPVAAITKPSGHDTDSAFLDFVVGSTRTVLSYYFHQAAYFHLS
jgi:hypothetical protein